MCSWQKVEDREEAAARERLSRMNVRTASTSRPAGASGSPSGSTGAAARPVSTNLETSSFFDSVDMDAGECLPARPGACLDPCGGLIEKPPKSLGWRFGTYP
jgi:hypothetical protein